MSQYFPNALAEFVFMRTYARWKEEEGRRETWPEAVDRVSSFLAEIARGRIPEEELREVSQAILNQEVVPSMRLLAMAGEAVRRNHCTSFNCFAGDERFLTDQGPVAFAEQVGHEVNVLAADGEWRPAQVQRFGVQPLQRVMLEHYNGGKHGKSRHVVYATPNHRWLLADGGETTEIKVGDKLLPSVLPATAVDPPMEAVRHGFFFGDGAISNKAKQPFAQVRLCGAKRQYAETIFAGMPQSKPPSCNGDVMVYCGKDHTAWKDLPIQVEAAYIAGFIAGLALADGSPTTAGNVYISTQRVELVAWLYDHAPLAGYKVLSHSVNDCATNFGQRSAPLHQILLGRGVAATLQVIEIAATDRLEEVFCVIEPVTHSFTLANGQVTGNCMYVAVNDLQVFPEILYLLMAGCGVGFSVESRYVNQLPVVNPRFAWDEYRAFVIPDDTEGWADALAFGLHRWFNGLDVRFDYSQIRPAGARLKTKGGRASGPEPLRGLLDFARDLVRGAEGRRLTPAECHHLICKIGDVVVMGGVRRSAEISLSDLTDTEIRDIKQFGYWNTAPHLSMANNSAVYEEKPDRETFDREWRALRESGSGERGIFNRQAANATRPTRRKAWEFGTNPCFAPGTLIQTREGHFPIEQLVGQAVEIWNGADWQLVDNFRITGRDQPMLKLTFHDGSSERVTPYHTVILADGRKIEAKDLLPGDALMRSGAPLTHGTIHASGAYLKGFLIGDGTRIAGDLPHLWLYAPKWGCAERLLASAGEIHLGDVRTNAVATLQFRGDTEPSRQVMQGLAPRKEALFPWTTIHKYCLPDEVFAWDYASKCAFIAGVMDADGTASDTSNGFLYQISSVHKDWLTDFQALLKTIGVASHLSLMHRGGVKDFGDGYGAYESKDCWRLTISQTGSVALAQQVAFDRLPSFADKSLRYRTNSKANRIIAVEADGIEPLVYCCTVEGAHTLALTDGLLWGQCGEIYLRGTHPLGGGEACNLSEVIARAHDTPASLARKVKIATLIGTLQATLTDFPYLRPGWQANCEEERLLGVSISGQMDCPQLANPALLGQLRSIAQVANIRYAHRLGINRSAAITCVKPSGNTSQTMDCSSGMHPRFAPYYIRRVRINTTDPLFWFIRAQGVPVFPEVGQSEETATTWVAEFPVKAPAGAITRDDKTALEQLEYWLLVKEHWCEHNPSQTIYVRPEEWDAVGDWVYTHFDQVGGLSFLPHSDHIYQLAPYEEITQEEYERRLAEFPDLDYSLLPNYEQEDMTTSSSELACVAGACDVA